MAEEVKNVTVTVGGENPNPNKVNGVIQRSNEWRQERIELMVSKIETYKQRIKNAQAQIKQLEQELAQ